MIGRDRDRDGDRCRDRRQGLEAGAGRGNFTLIILRWILLVFDGLVLLVLLLQ